MKEKNKTKNYQKEIGHGFKKPTDYARFFLGEFPKDCLFRDESWSPTSAVGWQLKP